MYRAMVGLAPVAVKVSPAAMLQLVGEEKAVTDSADANHFGEA